MALEPNVCSKCGYSPCLCNILDNGLNDIKKAITNINKRPVLPGTVADLAKELQNRKNKNNNG